MTLAAQLAQFVREVQPSDSSARAEEIMRLSLYDWAACAMAGIREPVAQILRDTALIPQEVGAIVVGDDRDTAPAISALINGATSHALDYDDTHFAHIGHPSTVIASAVLAAQPAAQGADVVSAILLGSELSVRIGIWLGRTHYQTGFHQTATAGTLGAALGAGRALGLSEAQLDAAIGLASTRAAGLKSQFGTMGKPYHAGLAAQAGVEAALLAREGFDTRGAGLDGPQGLGATHHGEANADAFEGLGQIWQMEQISHKFHACCHGLHAMLEAFAAFDTRPLPQDVKRVEVRTHPRWLSVCNIAAPMSGLECKFSYAHTAAMALHGVNTASLDVYSDASAIDPAMVSLRACVDVQGDPHLPETGASVRIETNNGKIEGRTADIATPLDVETRAKRLRVKAKALVGETLEAQLWEAVFAKRAPDLDALFKLMQA